MHESAALRGGKFSNLPNMNWRVSTCRHELTKSRRELECQPCDRWRNDPSREELACLAVRFGGTYGVLMFCFA